MKWTLPISMRIPFLLLTTFAITSIAAPVANPESDVKSSTKNRHPGYFCMGGFCFPSIYTKCPYSG